MSTWAETFDNFIEGNRRRRAGGATAHASLDRDECMLCDAYGADKRSLFVDCGYAVHEVVPEVIDIFDAGIKTHSHGYYLLICKSCRGRLLGALQGWANECRSLRGKPKDHDGDLELDDPERNIPVRINGTTRMLTAEEYTAFREGVDSSPDIGKDG